MNVQVMRHHDGGAHIVFDGRHGIEIEAFEAAFLERQLDAWDRGEVYENESDEAMFVFVDLPRDEYDMRHVSITLGRVWYEIPNATARELLRGLAVGLDYEEAVARYYECAIRQSGQLRMPNENLSEKHDGFWHLANVNGPLAVVTNSAVVISVQEFWDTYERLSEDSKCDSPGGAEYRRVLHEWIENQPEDMEEFIMQRVNASPKES